MLVLPCCLWAQHNMKSLQQPMRWDYNLRGAVRQVVAVQKYATGNDMNFQEVYDFDSAGHLTSYTKRGFGGERITRYPLKNRDMGRHTQYITGWGDDFEEVRQYGSKGQLLSSTHYIYGPKGSLAETVEYTYSPDSNVVTTRKVATYDKYERLKTVQLFTADELLLMTEKYKYDRYGNLVRRTQKFYEDDLQRTTVEERKYVYDKHKNWVRCSFYNDGKRVCDIERTLNYYGE